MGNHLINKTVDDLGISSLKVFYDFNSYSGNYINSLPTGEVSYSGEVKNFDSNFTGQASGSGFFNGQYIEIENTDSITSESATVIFSQKKTGSSNGVIFSHLDENGPSGWEVGINEANKYYFKHFVDGTPYYRFLDCYLAEQNMCAVSVGENGSCSLFRLDFAKEPKLGIVDLSLSQEERDALPKYYGCHSKSFNMPVHTISNGANWRIGSGEFLYEGYIDYLLYFDQEMFPDTIRRFMNSIYSESTLIDAVSGIGSGEITGYNKITSGVSGKIGESIALSDSFQKSGYYVYESGVAKTGTADISGFVYVPYTGLESISGTNQIGQTIYKKVHNLSYTFDITGELQADVLDDFESSGDYWHFSGNSGTFYGDSSIGPPDTIFGITGFDIVEVTGYVTGGIANEYEITENSGVIYNEYSYEPLYSPNTNFQISGAYYSGNQNAPDPQYFPNEISLLSKSESGYFYELIYDIYDAQKINFQSVPHENATYQKGTAFTEVTGEMPNLQFAINGVSQMTGEISYSKTEFNLPTFSVSTGCYLGDMEVFTFDDINSNDEILYDMTYSGEKQSLEITSISDYEDAPFASFETFNKQIFFNGVKIYSGVDYLDIGGFIPSGDVTQSTGIYFSYPKYRDGVSFTGNFDQPVTIQHEGIMPKGYVVFANGIRQSAVNIIEHANASDLISGTRFLDKGSVIYSVSKEEDN